MSSKTVRQMLGKDILESPQFYPGPVVYQKDSKFQRITAGNFAAYKILGVRGPITYALSPGKMTGYAFTNHELASPPSDGMVPILTVDLRASPVKGYMQAHHLRIKSAFAREGIATYWYIFYAQHMGGIVSDFDHLEGGKRLWKGLVRRAEKNGLKASIVDTSTEKEFSVSSETPDSLIWSLDAQKRPIVLVLERPSK